jgi:hypothetical protein
MAVNDLITFRKGTSSAWTSVNPVLASGEPGYDLTNSILKIGDGVSNWVALSGIGSTSVGGSSSSSVGVRGIISTTGTLTSFAVSGGYPVGYLDLFQDGVKLVSDLDFSATDGSNVTLNNSVPSGTVLEYLTMASGVSSGGSGGSSYDSRWDLFLPPAPTGVTASQGNAQATVSWTAPAVLSQTPITDYIVQYSSNSGSTWTTFSDGASTSTSVAVTGLSNGASYVFRVAGVNGVGTGTYSTASSAVTPGSMLEVLVVAGGGGGATSVGGGGGGGGVVYSSAVAYATGVQYIVTVGGGGAGVGSNTAGTNGSNSSFASLLAVAVGGGGGGSFGGNSSGKNGGSGGGGTGFTTDSRSLGGSGTNGQGYNGGNGAGPYGSGASGGGGGAASAGGNASGGSAGAGGDGVGSYSTLAAAASVGVLYSGTRYFSGGGAGISVGADQVTPVNGSNSVGSAGTANSGQGAGGDGGTAGGGGVVIIKSQVAATATTGSPVITNSEGSIIYTFTGTGSITF